MTFTTWFKFWYCIILWIITCIDYLLFLWVSLQVFKKRKKNGGNVLTHLFLWNNLHIICSEISRMSLTRFKYHFRISFCFITVTCKRLVKFFTITSEHTSCLVILHCRCLYSLSLFCITWNISGFCHNHRLDVDGRWEKLPLHTFDFTDSIYKIWHFHTNREHFPQWACLWVTSWPFPENVLG